MTFGSLVKWDDIEESTLRVDPNDDTHPQPYNRVTDQQVLRAFCDPNPSTPLRHNRRLSIGRDLQYKVLLVTGSFFQIARWWPWVCRFHGDNSPEHAQTCPLSKPKIVLRRLGSEPFQHAGWMPPPLAKQHAFPYYPAVRPLVVPNPRLIARGKRIVPEGVEVILATQPTPNYQPGMLL